MSCDARQKRSSVCAGRPRGLLWSTVSHAFLVSTRFLHQNPGPARRQSTDIVDFRLQKLLLDPPAGGSNSHARNPAKDLRLGHRRWRLEHVHVLDGVLQYGRCKDPSRLKTQRWACSSAAHSPTVRRHLFVSDILLQQDTPSAR